MREGGFGWLTRGGVRTSTREDKPHPSEQCSELTDEWGQTATTLTSGAATLCYNATA